MRYYVTTHCVWLAALVGLGAACTQPRQSLPPRSDASTAAEVNNVIPPSGKPEVGGGIDCNDSLEGCPGFTPTCIGPTCDAGVMPEVPGLLPPEHAPDVGPMYPTACPGGVKAFWDLPSDVSSLDFSPDGTFVAASARDGAVVVTRASDGMEFSRHQKHRQNVQVVRFSHSGLLLAAGSEDGSLTLWNVGPQPPRVWVHGGFVHSVDFSADDMNMVVGGQRGIYIVRTMNLASAQRLETQLYNRSVAFLPGDLEVIVAHGETAGRVGLFKAADLTPVRELSQHLDPVVRVAVPARNATHFVFANGNYLRVGIFSGSLVVPFDQHVKPIEDVRFSNDGVRFATAAPDATRVWTAGDWRVQRSFGPSAAVAFSPDGKRLARTEGRRVLVHCLD